MCTAHAFGTPEIHTTIIHCILSLVAKWVCVCVCMCMVVVVCMRAYCKYQRNFHFTNVPLYAWGHHGYESNDTHTIALTPKRAQIAPNKESEQKYSELICYLITLVFVSKIIFVRMRRKRFCVDWCKVQVNNSDWSEFNLCIDNIWWCMTETGDGDEYECRVDIQNTYTHSQSRTVYNWKFTHRTSDRFRDRVGNNIRRKEKHRSKWQTKKYWKGKIFMPFDRRKRVHFKESKQAKKTSQ